MYNTIIVPTDFLHEESTIQALKHAELLSDTEGRIVLLHVLEDVPYIVETTRETMGEWLKKSGVAADIEIRDGGSYHNIIESAKENQADLVLISSHKPGLGDYLLGSTAEKVVRHAPCAVLVER
ncbi:MAG: universal stress protein F [Cocleimonas sp.]|jgi:universal stress protein F